MLKARISSDSFSSHLEYLPVKNAESCLFFYLLFHLFSSTGFYFFIVQAEIKPTQENTVKVHCLPIVAQIKDLDRFLMLRCSLQSNRFFFFLILFFKFCFGEKF